LLKVTRELATVFDEGWDRACPLFRSNFSDDDVVPGGEFFPCIREHKGGVNSRVSVYGFKNFSGAKHRLG